MEPAHSLHFCSESRNNNFKILRFGFACCVILGHSILLSGDTTNRFGWSMSYMAVNCFFVISGFLVCRSLLQHDNLRDYIVARILRIYPALFLAVAACVFVIGWSLTPLDTATWFASDQTQRFLLHNSLLVVGPVEDSLPRMFINNPFPGKVNTPLWTLQYEVGLYLLLAVCWLVFRLIPARYRLRGFTLLVLVTTSVAMTCFLINIVRDTPATGVGASTIRFIALFFCGTAYYLLRRHIMLSGKVFILLSALVIAGSIYRPTFLIASYLSLGYLVLYLAYIPAGAIRRFNQLGDYSYGLYIFAFPVQQYFVLIWPQINGLLLFTVSMAATLPIAVASWHLLEKPALALKNTMVAATR